MSQFPTQLDSDTDLPRVDDNITEIGADAINALRAAMFNVEAEIGIGASGTVGSIAQRLSVSINPDGTISPSIIVAAVSLIGGLTDSQIAATAGIHESKLSLTYSTSSLYNLYVVLKTSVDILNGFLSLTGIKLEPHIDGTNYNHLLSAIHVDPTTSFVKINPSSSPSPGTNVVNRNTTNSDILIKDLNDDLVIHEKLDNTAGVTATTGGTVPPQNYSHMADGIYVSPENFSTIPQTNNDVQKIFDYIDGSSLLLLGSRIQNLYANGIARTSRSSSLLADGYGEPLVPVTSVTAYHLNVPPGPIASSPVDDFAHGDDVVVFNPTIQQLNTFNFDAQFSQVQSGDLLTINYGTGISYQFAVDSVKSIVSGINRTYAVRINGKNPVSDGYAMARIDKPLFHRNKFGVLGVARAPNLINSYESLIVINPRSAIALGNGFNPSEFDANHYNLYLSLLTNGNTSNIFSLPAIDITGNQGLTPGAYTLDSIVDNINLAFRSPGYNYRFVAFVYAGQIGIALADPYNNASFSIIAGSVDASGSYFSGSNASYIANVVDNFNVIDPLGFGISGAGIASPPPATAYANLNAARFAPTLLFYPLKRNFFYTDGVERDRLKSDPLISNNSQDANGDGFWNAEIISINVQPSRVEVVYKINLDLSASGLAKGKTIVVQPIATDNVLSNDINYGRFIMSDIGFNNCATPSAYTNITVYDAVHGTGISPFITFPINTFVNVYFSDDSVSFNAENVFDGTITGPYKRFFEIYVDGAGHTTSHERARFLNTGADISKINLYKVSPKLRGYTTTNNDKEIRLKIINYDQVTGLYTGQLGRWNPGPSTFTNLGPITNGKNAEVARFYDETNIDYIDFVFNTNPSTFTNRVIDIQLFKTLGIDQQFMQIASCQVDDTFKSISFLKDERQFGNVSEEQLTTSALDFIASPTRLLNENAIIRGFEIVSIPSNVFPFPNTITINGGTAVVNGKIVQLNNETISVPIIQEIIESGGSPPLNNTITWFICVNDKSEIELVASTDYDPNTGLGLSGAYGTLDHNRIFTVQNPNLITPVPYVIRGSYLSNIIENQKDITVIGIISATISIFGGAYVLTSSTVSDARRFAYNGYGGLSDPFILSTVGSFRNFVSLNNWITQLTQFKSSFSVDGNKVGAKVIVKGNFPITSAVTLDYLKKITFEGDDGSFNITSNIGFNVGNNIEFKNIRFDYNVLGSGNLVDFTNSCIKCTVTNNKNITIKNCQFTAPSSTRYSWVSFVFGAESNRLQNINITNNIFSSLDVSVDKNAAVVFAYNSTASAVSVIGPRLTNCFIEDNVCNKNQLIIIGSIIDGSSNIQNALVTVNTRIRGNVCGAIGFLNRKDTPSNTVNGSFITDKENLLVIEKNTCRFIYSSLATGIAGTGSSRPTEKLEVYSGATIIQDNACTWIHTGFRVPSTLGLPISPLTIRDNKFTAYDPLFLNDYYVGTSSINLNYAVIVIKTEG